MHQPTLRDVEAPFSVRATLQWMDLLLAVLDCYNTFTSLRLMQPQRILGRYGQPNCQCQRSTLWYHREFWAERKLAK